MAETSVENMLSVFERLLSPETKALFTTLVQEKIIVPSCDKKNEKVNYYMNIAGVSNFSLNYYANLYNVESEFIVKGNSSRKARGSTINIHAVMVYSESSLVFLSKNLNNIKWVEIILNEDKQYTPFETAAAFLHIADNWRKSKSEPQDETPQKKKTKPKKETQENKEK